MGKLNCALKTNENYFPPKLKASKLAEAPLTGSGIKDKEDRTANRTNVFRAQIFHFRTFSSYLSFPYKLEIIFCFIYDKVN